MAEWHFLLNWVRQESILFAVQICLPLHGKKILFFFQMNSVAALTRNLPLLEMEVIPISQGCPSFKWLRATLVGAILIGAISAGAMAPRTSCPHPQCALYHLLSPSHCAPHHCWFPLLLLHRMPQLTLCSLVVSSIITICCSSIPGYRLLQHYSLHFSASPCSLGHKREAWSPSLLLHLVQCSEQQPGGTQSVQFDPSWVTCSLQTTSWTTLLYQMKILPSIIKEIFCINL